LKWRFLWFRGAAAVAEGSPKDQGVGGGLEAKKEKKSRKRWDRKSPWQGTFYDGKEIKGNTGK